MLVQAMCVGCRIDDGGKEKERGLTRWNHASVGNKRVRVLVIFGNEVCG